MSTRIRAAAILLGAVSVAWATIPLRHTGLADTVLFVAITGVVFSALRLLLGWLPRPEHEFLASAPMYAWIYFHDALRFPPWEEIATVSILWLEVLHRSRPWHTAILGGLLTAYLLAAHLAESGSPLRALRPQSRVLALGAAILALSAAAAIISPATATSGALLRVLAALAIIAAAALTLPA
jgi:hypothetical protein